MSPVFRAKRASQRGGAAAPLTHPVACQQQQLRAPLPLASNAEKGPACIMYIRIYM